MKPQFLRHFYLRQSQLRLSSYVRLGLGIEASSHLLSFQQITSKPRVMSLNDIYNLTFLYLSPITIGVNQKIDLTHHYPNSFPKRMHSNCRNQTDLRVQLCMTTRNLEFLTIILQTKPLSQLNTQFQIQMRFNRSGLDKTASYLDDHLIT